jgi:hypothetical protein
LGREEVQQQGFQGFSVTGLTFPNDQHAPASGSQSFDLACVPFRVSLQLVDPELDIRGRHPTSPATFMAVPKAAMHENHGPVSAQNEIRRAGQSSIMQPEPEAERVKHPAHDQLRLGILSPNGAHVGTASLGRLMRSFGARHRRHESFVA